MERPEIESIRLRPGVFPNEAARVLRARIGIHRVELAVLATATDTPREICFAVGMYLSEAERCLKSKDLETAWSNLYRAREQLIGAYGADQISTMAQALCAEIGDDQNIAAWRVRTVKALLSQDIDSTSMTTEDNATLPCRRRRLCQAFKIRDDGQTEIFVRLAVHRHFQLTLLALGLPILASTIGLAAVSAHSFSNAHWKSSSPMPCVLAVMFGVVGALVSTAQRSSKMSTVTIADYMQLLAASCSRIPIGGVAGVTVWLFGIAAVGDGAVELNIANTLLAAFGAGFAERLVVQGANADRDDRK